MNKTKHLTIIIINLLVLNTVIAQEIISPYHVIEKSIEKLGGKDYLLTINTLYTKMKFKKENIQYTIISKEHIPNKTSTIIFEKDSAIYKSVFNGKNGYQIIREERDTIKTNKLLKNNIFNELDYIDKSLWKIELLGDDLIDGERVYKISAKQTTGIIRILYYSQVTFHLLKSVEFKNENDESYIMNDYSGYKKFGKLTHYSTLKQHDGPFKQELKMIKLLINEKVTSLDFK